MRSAVNIPDPKKIIALFSFLILQICSHIGENGIGTSHALFVCPKGRSVRTRSTLLSSKVFITSRQSPQIIVLSGRVIYVLHRFPFGQPAPGTASTGTSCSTGHPHLQPRIPGHNPDSTAHGSWGWYLFKSCNRFCHAARSRVEIGKSVSLAVSEYF